MSNAAGCKRKLVLGVAFAAMLSSLLATDVGNFVALETANTAMIFEKDADGTWVLLHYGARYANAADAKALRWTTRFGSSEHNSQNPVTYTTFGTECYGSRKSKMEMRGGLAVKHADGCLTTELVGESTEINDEPNGLTHLVLKLKDRHYPFYVTQHFRAAKSSDVIETWVELENREKGTVYLDRMASAALLLPNPASELWVQTMASDWACEGQLRESELVRGQSIAFGCRSGVRGARETNPSFMLTLGAKATERTGTVIGGVLCWSGMWEIDFYRDISDTLTLNMGVANAAGAYVLDAGKSIKLPKTALTWSDRGKGQVSRNFHRWAREVQLPAGRKLRPVLLNSWEGSYFSFTEQVLHDMMDGVKEMGGELFVLDDGWFGKGKYARDNDPTHRDHVGLGDWIEDLNHIPNGLAALDREARSRGLKFGFWVEPEMICTNSWLYEAHPDWVLRERNRRLRVGRGNSQTVLDYTNPAVRDNIFSQLDALYSKMPELAYIKWDANADFMNYGSTYLDAEHQANLAFDYTMGVYELERRLRAKYPNLDVQACSSGGGHMEYGALEFNDEFWASDDSDARERVFIQWGASQFYPACTMGAHVTGVPNHQTRRITPLKYRFDIAMSGRFGFELHPKDLTTEELAFAKQCVAEYKRLRPTIQQGDLYRLVSPYANNYAALTYVNEARTEAVVFAFGLEAGVRRDYQPVMRLDGLDPARRYRIKEINLYGNARHSLLDGRVVGGDALMGEGMRFALRRDYDSAVFVLTATK